MLIHLSHFIAKDLDDVSRRFQVLAKQHQYYHIHLGLVRGRAMVDG